MASRPLLLLLLSLVSARELNLRAVVRRNYNMTEVGLGTRHLSPSARSCCPVTQVLVLLGARLSLPSCDSSLGRPRKALEERRGPWRAEVGPR